MTSPNTGLRRTALVVLAVGTAIGASACSAGQISQTANQVAAVDGGRGSVGDVSVNDLQVVVPAEGEGDEARVAFAISRTGYGTDAGITIDSIEVDGVEAELGEAQPLQRACTIVYTAIEVPAPADEADICLQNTEATIPVSEDLKYGSTAPVTLTLSNGDRLEIGAAVVSPPVEAGEYVRPSETHAATEGH